MSSQINGRALEEYLPTRVHRMVAQAPLRLVGREKDYDIVVTIKGGGDQRPGRRHPTGDRSGPHRDRARASGQLKAEGFLTRDAREKERRKYGLKKARKAPQYSKR